MTKAVLLNSATGQLETTQVLPVVALRPIPSFKEVTRSNGVITQISIYTSSAKTVELYRKVITRSSGQITSITETDYTRNPSVSRTKTIARSNGSIISIEVT